MDARLVDFFKLINIDTALRQVCGFDLGRLKFTASFRMSRRLAFERDEWVALYSDWPQAQA